MSEYVNDDPAENKDNIEYVLPNLPSPTCSNEDIYFTNTIDVNPIVSSKKGSVVVKGTPEGIYELAGENAGVYDLSSEVTNTAIDDKDSTPTNCCSSISKYKVHILSGIVVLIIISLSSALVILEFNCSKKQDNEQTNTTTIRAPTTTEWTGGKT